MLIKLLMGILTLILDAVGSAGKTWSLLMPWMIMGLGLLIMLSNPGPQGAVIAGFGAIIGIVRYRLTRQP